MSNLQKALKSLKKSKIVDMKKSVVEMGDGTEPIPCIPTGSIVLDYLIGGYRTEGGEKRCPGIPRGRITEIFGPEGSGKCVRAGTYVHSEYGMLTIEELFEKCGKPIETTEKIEEHEVRLLNENGEMESTSHLTWNGEQKVFDIQNQLGMKVGVTGNHPLRVMSPEGNIVWKNAEDIRVGDALVLMSKGNFPSKCEISEEESRWLGYLVADGSLTSEDRIGFSNSDEDIISDYYQITKNLFGSSTPILSYSKSDSDTIDHHINSTSLRDKVATKYGLDYVVASEKEVPFCVRQGTRKVQEAFLRAYVDLECHIDSTKRAIEVTSASKELLDQVQLILLSMGYLSVLSEKKVKNYPDNDYWRLTWAGEYASRYAEEIGFISEQRKESIANFSDRPFNSNVDGVPNISGLLKTLYTHTEGTNRSDNRLFGDYMSGRANPSRTRLASILEVLEGRTNPEGMRVARQLQDLLDKDYFFSPVVSIDTEEDVPTFDVSLPETHSFWSNGFISHNTTVAIHTAIQCQKEGGSVCFLDYEHAFAPTYAADLGLDIQSENFLLVQPLHWEEGAEIIKAMAESGVDLIIVDSVAAMKPQKDIEDNDVSSTGQLGHIARLQSSFLPKIVKGIEESGTALIYINQLRSRIKTSMYDTGPDEETSGGRALKYYASLRLMVKRCRTEYSQVENEMTGKSDKQPISNIVRAKNVKNKVSRHQGHSGEFVIRYGEGIDNVRSVIDIADSRNVLQRGGAWYTFTNAQGEEVKQQGKENLREYLLENPDDFQEIVKQVASFSKGFKKAGKVSDDDIMVEEHDMGDDEDQDE